MKVLQVHKYYSRKRGGGSVSVLFEVEKLLHNYNNQTMIFAMDDPKNEPTKYSKFFANHFDIRTASNLIQKMKLTFRVVYNRDATKKLDKLLTTEKPDVAHVYNIYHYLTPGIFRVLKKHNVPVVFELTDYHAICPNYKLFSHGKINNSCKDKKYYKLFFNKLINNSWAESFIAMVEGYVNKWFAFYDDVDMFLAPSQFMKKKCVEYGIPAEKIIVLRNVLNFDDYKQIVQKKKMFLYMGRISQEKGLEIAVDAMKKLKDEKTLNGWKLIIAGKGPYEKVIHDYVRANGMDDVITFVGFHQKGSEEWTKLMSESSVGVLSSIWYDNAPVAISESMVFRAPVIVSGCGGTKEIIEDNKSGFVFETGNSDNLAQKMKKFVDDSDLVKKMGNNAHERVNEFNNEDKYYEGLMDIYNKAVNL